MESVVGSLCTYVTAASICWTFSQLCCRDSESYQTKEFERKNKNVRDSKSGTMFQVCSIHRSNSTRFTKTYIQFKILCIWFYSKNQFGRTGIEFVRNELNNLTIKCNACSRISPQLNFNNVFPMIRRCTIFARNTQTSSRKMMKWWW